MFIGSRPLFFLATADSEGRPDCSYTGGLPGFVRVRLRVNGWASVHHDDQLLSEFGGAQLIVRVAAQGILPNCPRYIHKMQIVEHSVYAPREGHTPPVPQWKERPEFREVLPGRNAGASDR